MKKYLLVCLSLLCFTLVFGQPEKKRVMAIAVSQAPKIDGVLDEAVWQSAPVAGDFVQRQPYIGKPAGLRTEVRFLYDNTGLYVGAMMYDPHPDSIPCQLGLRDANSLNADNFILVLSPFNDGLNAFCFMVYSSEVQVDFKLSGSNGNDDYTWDAVWTSKARRNDKGWVVEMKIPYSAIRFPKKPVQEWGINCQRSIRRTREVDTWNIVDAKVSGYVNQCGLLEGIKDIVPPLRLSISPYLSGYLQNSPGEHNYNLSYNYGADLKYGLNQSFTLDMTLIPDFGQVRSDDKVYNFSPFEIRYDERRQFFTEGTELFNKGGLFYSRRIGGMPKGYGNVASGLQENEKIDDNPVQTKLINATKISGRTSGGLGIGLFNGMSANTWATVSDTLTGKTRRVLTQGFTNYNMIVLDQNLKHNSFIDFMNTNYYMPTEGYTANVTGTSFKFANKKYTYAFTGDGFVSQKYYSHQPSDLGYHYSLSYGKISGNFHFGLTQLLETENYDPNDMGFNPVNNRFNNSVYFEYNKYEPFWKVNNWYNYFMVYYNTLCTGLKYAAVALHAETNTTTKKYLSLGANADFQPVKSHDYFEPRVAGWMFVSPAYASFNPWISTDYRKTFALDANLGGYVAPGFKSTGYSISFDPRLRLSDRLMLIYHILYERIQNDEGYVTDSVNNAGNTVILFGRRDRRTVTNILEANFMVNSEMSINLRVRHYWVAAPYYAFSILQHDGNLQPVDYHGNHDLDYNLFNLDLGYTWNFAPGSQITVMWKNAINTDNHDIEPNFFNNLANTLSSDASNSFSVRIFYFLDTQYFKKKRNIEAKKWSSML
ncbi:MAG: DUF5916 domain-containing protein [Bacteroidota bacterium]